MVAAEILTSIMGAYLVYMLQKIDSRQDKIEMDVEIIKHSIHKRKDDLTDDLTAY